MPDRATAPLDLLREFRRVFEHDAGEFREQQRQAAHGSAKRVYGAKALMCEQAVRKIDATLRDWA